MTGRRRPLSVGLATAALVCLALVRPGTASGSAPRGVGWWTTASALGGVPVPVPVPTLVPATDDVPEGGFEVAGTSQSPTSIAAIVYDVPAGSTIGDLILDIAPGPLLLPGTTVQLCPLTGGRTFEPIDGGPITDAPPWDCSRSVGGRMNGSGTAVRFAARGLVAEGTLSVAIVPSSLLARIVFQAPGAGSLVLAAPRPQVSVPLPDSVPTPVDRPAGPAAPAVVPPARGAPSAPGSVATPGAPALDSTVSTPGPVQRTNRATDLGAGSATMGALVLAGMTAVIWTRNRRALTAVVNPGSTRTLEVPR